MLIICKIQADTEYRLNMFNTNGFQDRYCLFFYEHNIEYSPIDKKTTESSRIHHLTSYCLRPSEDDDIDNNLNRDGDKYTFLDLKQRNITSTMLLLWHASLDIAEHYQIFLNNNSNLTSMDKFVFYNCTPPWFGPFCQFSPIRGKLSYSTMLLAYTFSRKQPVERGSKVTCYQHLVCQTYLSCLDWREICDGKNDCLDGLDEKDCWQLEISQCNTNEYRCRNGQCIPKEFVHDRLYFPDCADRTDEPLYDVTLGDCSRFSLWKW